MRRIQITAGVDKDKNSMPVLNLDSILNEVRQELALRFGGFTENHGVGGWVTHNRELVQERCITWTILAKRFDDGAAEAAAEMIRSSFNQFSVVLTEDKVDGIFLEG